MGLQLTISAPTVCDMKPACPYCCSAEGRKRLPQPDWDAIRREVFWLHEKRGVTEAIFSYGEPTCDSNCMEFAAELMAAGVPVFVQSHMMNPERFGKLDPYGPLTVGASYHPHLGEFGRWAYNFKRLVGCGYKVRNVTLVAWPEWFNEIPRMTAQVRELGAVVIVKPFWGQCGGQRYPDAYTDTQKARLRALAREQFGHSEIAFPSTGKFCRAGRDYAQMNHDGTVARCWDEWLSTGERGFASEGFPLADDLEPCRADHCVCQDLWRYIEHNEPRKRESGDDQ